MPSDLRVLGDPVDRRDDLRDVGGAVGVRDLDADDARVRGHAEEVVAASAGLLGVHARVAAGDDARHVRAVTERVEVAGRLVLRLGGEVRAVEDLALAGQALHRRHAGVDDRDVDALARAALRPHRADADELGDVAQRVRVGGGVVGRDLLGRGLRLGGRLGVVLAGLGRGQRDLRVRRQRGDSAVARELRRRLRIQGDRRAVDRLQLAGDLAAGLADLVQDLGELRGGRAHDVVAGRQGHVVHLDAARGERAEQQGDAETRGNRARPAAPPRPRIHRTRHETDPHLIAGPSDPDDLRSWTQDLGVRLHVRGVVVNSLPVVTMPSTCGGTDPEESPATLRRV